MSALRITNILALVIFIGLVAWEISFQDIIRQTQEPYSDEVEENEDTLELTSEAPADEEAAQEQEGYVFGTSAVHPLAVRAGNRVVENGGNAAEAAIAVSFVLGVVEPYGSGIGGGGMMLVHDPDQGVRSFDYREAAASSGAWPERGVAVPGLVKGMELLHEEYWSGEEETSWEALLEDAIEYAEDGVLVDQILTNRIDSATRYIDMDEQNREYFYPGGLAIERYETLQQPALAETMKKIQASGAAGFYEGEVADALVNATSFTHEDLLNYDVYESEPVSGEFENRRIYGTASPSASTTLIQMLQMADQLDVYETLSAIEGFDGLDLDPNMKLGHLVNEDEWYPVYVHLMSEVTKAAYGDRLETVGDPQFNPEIDTNTFTEPTYTQSLIDGNEEQSGINVDRISYNDQYDSPAEINDSRHTTHFVIVDQDGMMVSATHSLGEFFGSGRYVEGMFLNNQLNNFSPRDESPNSYAPGKRPRTFVSPVILEGEHGQAELGLGTPGGRRIPAMLFQTIMEYTYGVNEDTGEPYTLQEAISRPRFYTEGNLVNYERSMDDDMRRIFFEDFGYDLRQESSPLYYGGIQGIGLEYSDAGHVQRIFGGGDPRRNGAWQLGTHEGTQEEQGAGEDELDE
ncbi:gamma-glutamyltransferase [Bacillus sp. H-16]|uniref:gamma-glutamyltransferase family protein n=1 Tax=Alteribacter salitolerans TaxID=2912333 RepID=UPI0019662ECB|nr:gamma-glutamyltransferase [Alteribacter salitolerans]MBM7095658.1 gamma-glutamyltransferase [Alteribacter salitolerans]